MKSSSHLVKCKNRAYCFRLVIPEDLRPQLGRREIRKSLGTRDHREAQVMAWKMVDQWKTVFRRIRMQRLASEPGFYSQIKFAGLCIENGALKADSVEIDPDKADQEMLLLDRILDTVGSKQKEGETAQTILLSNLFEQYAAERVAVKNWTLSTEKENRTAFEQILSVLGDRPAEKVTRQDARQLLQTMQTLKSSKGSSYSLSVVNKRLGLMSSLFRWAEREGLVPHNPFNGLQVKNSVPAHQQKGIYTSSELSLLFDPSRYVVDPRRKSRWWIPLLCLLSACRVGEAAQLRIDSVKQVNGVWVMEFDASMRLKTPNAQRIVPVHEELIRLGLLTFIEQKKTAVHPSNKDQRLFTELRIDSARAGGAVSNWWNNWYQQKCGVNRSGVSLHSLRHGAETLMRAAGIPETIAAEVVGHERGASMSYGRYAKPGQIAPLVEAISAIDYGDLLSGLLAWK